MKKIKCSLFIMLLFCISSPILYAKDTIKTCLDYTPYQLDNTGKKKWNGKNIETLYQLSQQLNMTLDMSMRAPFTRCFRLLEQGEIDVLAGLIFTEERNKKFLLIPYSQKNPLAIFYLKTRDEPVDINNLGYVDIIGSHRGFALPKHIINSPLYKHITPVESVGVGLLMANKHRLTGVLATLENGQSIINDWEELKNRFNYVVLDNKGDQSINFAINKGSPLVNKVQDITKAIKDLCSQHSNAHLCI